MPASGIKLVDSNVWLAAVFSDHQHHLPARQWFDIQQNGTVAFCRITQLALLRHLTNTAIMGKFVQSQQSAWKTYEKLANDPRIIFLTEPAGVEPVFRTLSQASTSSHERWTDAYLAAFALVSQSQMVTFDQGFRKFPKLETHILPHVH